MFPPPRLFQPLPRHRRVGAAELLKQRHRLRQHRLSLGKVFLLDVECADIPEVDGDTCFIAQLAVNGKGLPIVVEGLIEVAALFENLADVVEVDGDTCFIAQLAVNGEGLIVVVEGLVEIAPLFENLADVVEPDGDTCFIAQLAVNGEGLIVVVEGLVEVAPLFENLADVVETPAICSLTPNSRTISRHCW